MSWILVASFVCSALAITYSLYVARRDFFDQVGQALKLSAVLFSLFRQSLQRTVFKNKALSVVAVAACIWLLILGRYWLFGVFSVGLVAPCVVGTFGWAIDDAVQRLAGDHHLREQLYRSRCVRALMVTGCGLLGSAAIIYIASSGILSSAGTDPGILDLFACGIYGGAALFWRACPAETSCLSSGSVSGSEATAAIESNRNGRTTSTSGGAASWDAFLFGSYTVVFVVAAVTARAVCGTTSHATDPPMLIGTVGLLACLLSSWFTGASHMHRVDHSQAMHWFAPGGALILACAVLFLLRDQLQVVLLPEAAYGERDANLLPAALAGIFLSGLMLVISEIGKQPWPKSSHNEKTGSITDRTTMVRRAMMATFVTVVPFLLTVVCLASGYHVVDTVDRSHAAGIMGIAIAGVGLLSISGIAGAPGSEDVNLALRKLYHTETLALVGLGLYVHYAVAVAELEKKNLAFDLSDPYVLLGLLIGGLIPYLIVALWVAASVKFVMSIAREIAVRYRARQ